MSEAYVITSDGGIDALERRAIERKPLGHGEVRVAVRAVSLNYRDLMTVKDPGPRGIVYPRIPCSDGAGLVIECGPGVSAFEPGDRVAGCFFQGWQAGPIDAAIMATAMGGAIDGMLATETVLDQHGLVRLPEHLSFAEGATLPCAALTAWNALIESGLRPGETVLLIGTGGVSIFALQFALEAGARPILISSSDAKIERARALGAQACINYRDTPEWDRAVRDLTGGTGVDQVVEVGGAGTLERSIEAVRVAGRIALIGVLTGGTINPTPIMRKSVAMRGIYVGSRTMFEAMNRAISASGLKPVIDQVFPFEAAKDALRAMEAAGHFGKLVITMEGS